MDTSIRLNTAADLLSVIPYLLGFHPADSLVMVGVQRTSICFQMRADLPDEHDLAQVTQHCATVLARQRIRGAVLLGYGPAERIDPAMYALSRACALHRIYLIDVLRVGDRRYWSYLCESSSCCPTAGRPFDPVTGPLATAAVVSGRVALPTRREVERQLAPVTGAPRQMINEATRRASERVTAVHTAATRRTGREPAAGRELITGRELIAGRVLHRVGRRSVDAALAHTRAGGRLDTDEMAWLTVVLAYPSVREHARRRCGRDPKTGVTLWTDVLRRAAPELMAAPAALLGYAALLCGGGPVATIAIQRALDADPHDRMAQALAYAVVEGLSPEAVAEIRSGWV